MKTVHLPSALSSLRPRVYNGLLFLDEEMPDDDEIRRVVSKYGPVAAQRFFTHVHLQQLTSDLAQQRAWATELTSIVRQSFHYHKEYFLISEVRDDGFDVEVSFYVVSRPKTAEKSAECARP